MGSKELDQLRGHVNAGLQICNADTAENLIGEPPPEEYGLIIKAVQASWRMLWLLARTGGMKQTKALLKSGAQSLTIILQLVNYAYALGVREGMSRGVVSPEQEGGE